MTTDLDSFLSAHQECADRLTELEATVRLLEDENARLKADLGTAWFVGGERVRNGIVAWLRQQASDEVAFTAFMLSMVADQVAACEDIKDRKSVV